MVLPSEFNLINLLLVYIHSWCEEDILKCYRDAAEYDDALFGNYDYEKIVKES